MLTEGTDLTPPTLVLIIIYFLVKYAQSFIISVNICAQIGGKRQGLLFFKRQPFWGVLAHARKHPLSGHCLPSSILNYRNVSQEWVGGQEADAASSRILASGNE
jgi:hypothetical protein